MAEATTDTDKPQPSAQITHELSRPIPAHGEEISEISFREPSAADIQSAGVPVSLDLSGDAPVPIFDAKRMSAMMSLLAGVPPSSIAKMASNDWTACAYALVPFFMPWKRKTS